MNDLSQPKRWPLNIYQDAYLSAVRRAKIIVASLESAKHEVAQFQALCDLLLDKGLQFEAESYSSDSGYVIHTIRLVHGEQHKQAGKMILALANLGCDEKSMSVCDISKRVNYQIVTGAGVNPPLEFMLTVRGVANDIFAMESSHAEPLAA